MSELAVITEHDHFLARLATTGEDADEAVQITMAAAAKRF